MTKEFIPYEQALALKELGFDEPCLGLYLMKEFRYCNPPMIKEHTTEGIDLLAPLYQQAFRWFEDKCKTRFYITNNIYAEENDYLIFEYSVLNVDIEEVFNVTSNVREEAELACLRKLIEMI